MIKAVAEIFDLSLVGLSALFLSVSALGGTYFLFSAVFEAVSAVVS
jgi:hypothetical protein